MCINRYDTIKIPMRRELLQSFWSAKPVRKVAMLLAGLVVFWPLVLTALMLHEDPASFHCGEAICSVADVTLLLGRNALVVLWLVAPYFLVGWAVWRLAGRINRALPRWLRWHPRWTYPTRIIVGTLLALGHVAVAFVTYAMLEHNPQGVYCPHVSSDAEGNYYGYGPCYITLSELTVLFATNISLLGIVFVPLAVVGWLFTALAVFLESGRGQR